MRPCRDGGPEAAANDLPVPFGPSCARRAVVGFGGGFVRSHVRSPFAVRVPAPRPFGLSRRTTYDAQVPLGGWPARRAEARSLGSPRCGIRQGDRNAFERKKSFAQRSSTVPGPEWGSGPPRPRPVRSVSRSKSFVLVSSLSFGVAYAQRTAARGIQECQRRHVGGPHHTRNVNDPSAGSPTETLLRLLLPLNDQVWSSSQRHRRRRNLAAYRSEDLTKSFNR